MQKRTISYTTNAICANTGAIGLRLVDADGLVHDYVTPEVNGDIRIPGDWEGDFTASIHATSGGTETPTATMYDSANNILAEQLFDGSYSTPFEISTLARVVFGCQPNPA